MKNYTEKEIEILQAKADKWDSLGKKIETCYAQEGDEDFDEHEGEADLVTIGELAASASAYGYL